MLSAMTRQPHTATIRTMSARHWSGPGIGLQSISPPSVRRTPRAICQMSAASDRAGPPSIVSTNRESSQSTMHPTMRVSPKKVISVASARRVEDPPLGMARA